MLNIIFYLDTRRLLQNGNNNPLRVKFTKERKAAFLTLDLKLHSNQWDPRSQKVINHPDAFALNMMLASKLSSISSYLSRIDIRSKNATEIRDLAAAIEYENDISKKEDQYKDSECFDNVETFFKRYIEHKNLSNRTKELYMTTWRRIVAWKGKLGASCLLFKDIDLGFIEDFDNFLSSTAPSANARRVHHANFKAVINYAVDHDIINRNPYRRYRIRTETTKKRNMSVDSLRRVIFCDGLDKRIEKYRDFFTLSFMMRGLNTIDLCGLNKPKNGRIELRRAKTGQLLSIKIEPEMLHIIDKYSGRKLLLSFAEGRNYRDFNKRLSKALHTIRDCANRGRGNSIEIPDFTMYWARHTWATVAYRLGISKDVIGEALGHSQNSVTDIYIERDNDKVDAANRRVLDFVFYGKS